MWQLSVPFNLTTWIPQHDHPLNKDSLAHTPDSPEEETLESQVEYPREEEVVVEEVKGPREVEEEAIQEDLQHHNREQTTPTN